MIKITNCFKIEPDFDKVSSEEWSEFATAGNVDLSYLKSRINLQDEGALELTLRYRDSAAADNLECSLSALSAGAKTVTNTLQTLAALGFAKTDRIVWDEQFAPLRTAKVIADAIEAAGDQDLIVCGGQSGTGSNRSVPLLISELLGVPCITGVTEFTPRDEKSVRVSYKRDGMAVTETVMFPVILAVGDVAQAYLRVPTLMQRMATMSQPTGEIEPECELGENAKFMGFRFLDNSRNGELIDGTNPDEAADAILAMLKQEGVVK